MTSDARSVPPSDPELAGGSQPDPPNPPAVVLPAIGPALFDGLRAGNYRKVVVQVPAGLTRDAHDIARRIRTEVGLPAVVATRACFGACDLPSRDEAPGADVAVVLGHAPIPNVVHPLPTFFVEMRDPRGDAQALARAVEAAGLPKRIGLVASIQHLDLVEPLKRALGERGFEPLTGAGDRRIAYAAQALGCNYTTAEALRDRVEAFLFVGTGRFHPLGLALAVDRPVWTLDPLQAAVEPPLDRERLIGRRLLLVAKAREFRRWGILVSSFAGQHREGMARSLQRRALERGREAEIFVTSRLDPNDLAGRAVEAYVNTACPRIALDDSELYPRPMLTPPEFLMVLGDLPLEPYRFDTYH